MQQRGHTPADQCPFEPLSERVVADLAAQAHVGSQRGRRQGAVGRAAADRFDNASGGRFSVLQEVWPGVDRRDLHVPTDAADDCQPPTVKNRLVEHAPGNLSGNPQVAASLLVTRFQIERYRQVFRQPQG